MWYGGMVIKWRIRCFTYNFDAGHLWLVHMVRTGHLAILRSYWVHLLHRSTSQMSVGHSWASGQLASWLVISNGEFLFSPRYVLIGTGGLRNCWWKKNQQNVFWKKYSCVRPFKKVIQKTCCYSIPVRARYILFSNRRRPGLQSCMTICTEWDATGWSDGGVAPVMAL